MKVQRKDVEAAVARLAARLGKPSGPAWVKREDGIGNRARVGVWELDYNPIYGGYVVEEIHNEAGGICRPLGDTRMKGEQFLEALYMVNRALDLKEAAR